MKKISPKLILPAILIVYALTYMATSTPEKPCDSCQKLYDLYSNLNANRNYVLNVNDCGKLRGQLDTICITVKDTTGINWMRFADTACINANQLNMNTKRIYILKGYINPIDTLATVSCP